MAERYSIVEETEMSDKTHLISVEDLIYQAFAIYKDNRVDFKLLQSIFLILARELRLLQQDVHVKFYDIIEFARINQADDSSDSGTYLSSSNDERGRKTSKIREQKGRAGKEAKRDKKDRGKKGDKMERGGKGEKEEPRSRGGTGEEDDKISLKGRERKGRSKDRDEKDEKTRGRDKKSKDRDDKDQRSTERDKSSKRKKGDDYVDENGRERGRDRERGGEQGADGREGARGEREADGRGGRGGEREADGRGGRPGERDVDGRGGKGGEREADGRGGRGGERVAEGRERRGSKREAVGRRGRGGEREADGRDGRGGVRETNERGGRRGEREADGRGGRQGDRKDRDAQRQDRGGLGREFGSQSSGTSITVTEATRMGPRGKGSVDKILVAERGPAARGRPARIGSIDVVTASQFAPLMEAVKQLEQITGPQLAPVLPEDQTLRQDLAKGRASLQDTMQAMQLNERVQEAELSLNRLAGLLTQLALSDMLPPEFADHVEAMEEYLQDAIAEGHAAASQDGPGSHSGPGGPDDLGQLRMGETASTMDGKKSKANMNAALAAAAAAAAAEKDKEGVTHHELFEVIQNITEALMKEMTLMIARANHSAEGAASTSKSVAEKIDTAMHVNTRINTLFQQTDGYNQQLSGFDSGIMTQVKNFQVDLVRMKKDLAKGLALLDELNNDAEVAALLDLTERHQDVVIELENTVHLHKNLSFIQYQINDELKSVKKSVDILREQKSERGEMLDALKDKANVSCLTGLLEEKVYTVARSDINKRLLKCLNKFNSKEAKWQGSLKELMNVVSNKGEMLRLMALKDAAGLQFNAVQRLLCKLEDMLGEPEAAILMRKLAKDATCAACQSRALMEPQDFTYGKPLPLPVLRPPRPPPLGAEQGSGEVKLAPPDTRDHICRRWVGGSHTLIAGNIVKKRAKPLHLPTIPTMKFEGTGSDGRYYLMEEDMQPCAECNKVSPCEYPPVDMKGYPCSPAGAGDQSPGPSALKTPETRR